MPFPRRRVVHEDDEYAPPPSRPNPWPWLLLLGLLVAGAVAGLWYWQEQDDEETARTTTTVVHTVEEAPAGTTTLEIERPEDVVGLMHAGGGTVLEAAGYRTDSYPVESSEPRGTVIAARVAGDTAKIDVSLGDGPREQREVPDVTGPAEVDARAELRDAGFTVRTLDRDAPTDEEVGEVLLQAPDAGMRLPELAQVTIYVGR